MTALDDYLTFPAPPVGGVSRGLDGAIQVLLTRIKLFVYYVEARQRRRSQIASTLGRPRGAGRPLISKRSWVGYVKSQLNKTSAKNRLITCR